MPAKSAQLTIRSERTGSPRRNRPCAPARVFTSRRLCGLRRTTASPLVVLPGASTHPLNDAQAALDAAVADAYGMPPDQSPTEFLLELNQLVAEDEEQGRKVRGPGLPDHLDPKGPRWFSTDCIEPPKVES